MFCFRKKGLKQQNKDRGGEQDRGGRSLFGPGTDRVSDPSSDENDLR